MKLGVHFIGIYQKTMLREWAVTATSKLRPIAPVFHTGFNLIHVTEERGRTSSLPLRSVVFQAAKSFENTHLSSRELKHRRKTQSRPNRLALVRRRFAHPSVEWVTWLQQRNKVSAEYSKEVWQLGAPVPLRGVCNRPVPCSREWPLQPCRRIRSSISTGDVSLIHCVTTDPKKPARP